MLFGTRDTASWGLGLEDVTNQYILEGVRGGFVTLVLFCVILFVGARAAVRLSLRSRDERESYLAWGVFVTIIGHCLSFIGVSYFGQIDHDLVSSARERRVRVQPGLQGPSWPRAWR